MSLHLNSWWGKREGERGRGGWGERGRGGRGRGGGGRENKLTLFVKISVVTTRSSIKPFAHNFIVPHSALCCIHIAVVYLFTQEPPPPPPPPPHAEAKALGEKVNATRLHIHK